MKALNKGQGIGSESVDVWSGQLALASDQLQSLLAILDDDERRKAEAFKLPLMRNRFIAVRGSLRHALAHYLDAEPSDLRFEITEHGKPRLACESLYFNLSHTGDSLVIAVAGFPDIGIDIEIIRTRPSIDSIAERVFSERELRLWQQLKPEQQLACFYRLWTKKEAFVKAVGRGIALGMELCEFELELDGQLLAAPAEYGPVSAWQVIALPVSDEMSAAMVTARRPYELRRRELESIMPGLGHNKVALALKSTLLCCERD